MRRLFLLLVFAIVILSVLLGFKIQEQRAALVGPAGGSGTIEGDTVRVSSRVGGRLVEVAVEEGQSVEAGALLLRLDCVEPEAILAEASARLEAARAQAEAAASAASGARSGAQAARAQVQAADAQIRAAEAQGEAAERQAGRLAQAEGEVPAAQRDQADTAAVGLSAQVEAARAQRRAGAAQARAVGAQAEAAGAQASAAELSVRAGEAALSRAQVAVEECRVVAPRAGVVELLPYQQGELVGPGMTLAHLLDMSEVTATFYLPNAELAAARPGGRAQVSADAWPDRVFQGTVRRVASEPEFTPRNIQTRTDRDRLVYRVEVEVPNEDAALRPGMPVEVRLAGTGPATASAGGQ